MKYVGITEVIASADLLRINDFNTQTKVEMLSDIELEIQRDVMLLSTEDISLPYWPDEWNEGEVYEKGSKVSLGDVIYEKVTADEGGSPDADVSAWVKSDIYLSIPYPHAALYKHYLIALYDFYLQDYQNYANDLEMAKSHLYAFSAWWCEFVNPATKMKEPVILSAYALAVKHGFKGSEEEWIASLKGDKGDKGDIGEGLEIKGVVFNLEDLPTNANSGDVWAYLYDVESAPDDWGISEIERTGELYLWDGSKWECLGSYRGAKGDKGDTGKDGRSITNVTSIVAGDTVYLTIWYDDYTSEETSFPLPEPGKGINSVRYYETYENGDVELSIEYTDGTYQFVTIPGLKAEKTYEWEHIGTITVEADEDGSLPQSIIFSEDSNGNPLALDAFYIRASAGATDGSAARITVNADSDKKSIIPLIGNMNLSLQGTLRKFYVQFVKNKEWKYAEASAMSSIANTIDYPNSNIYNTHKQIIPPYEYDNVDTIKKVELKLMVGTEKTWTAGSKFELYGVRK